MLRLILRHTHNALLFACILLLLCSFERLCRYDFNQIQLTSNNILEEGLQVDHFVFWGGIPAWERSLEAKNPVSVGLSKFMSWAGYTNHIIIKPPSILPPAAEEMLLSTAKPLTEANLVMKRQIRHNKKKHRASDSRSKEDIAKEQQLEEGGGEAAQEGEATTEQASSKENTLATKPTATVTATAVPRPKIGFVLHLPSCDREAIATWQKAWKEQALDQPFLFYILLGAAVEDACAAGLEEELLSTNEVVYQVSRNERLAITLQTCGNPFDHIPEPAQELDELLYYDASKAVGRIRSSASMRRFQPISRRTTAPSWFACAGGQSRPAFCEDNVLDCPWFQYSPPSDTEPSATQLPASTT